MTEQEQGSKTLEFIGKVTGVVLALLVILGMLMGLGMLLALPVMWAWNGSMPEIFGLPEIRYWTAVSLFWLCAALLWRLPPRLFIGGSKDASDG